MLDPDDQKRIVAMVAKQASTKGFLVAPVGSVFFLFHDSARALTKDVDLVIHKEDLEVADLHLLRQLAQTLGDVEVSQDRAVVRIRLGESTSEQGPEIELIRGRSKTSKGYIPRKLLAEAARLARREGNILLYPEEFVLVLKADASVDREQRAQENPERASENRARAQVFRADVFGQSRRMALSGKIDPERIEAAISYLKKNRRQAVRKVLEEAGAFG